MPQIPRKGPSKGVPLTDQEAAHLALLVAAISWNARAFHAAFEKENVDLRRGDSGDSAKYVYEYDHFLGLITTRGKRKPLRPHLKGAFAKAFKVTRDSFLCFLDTGDVENLVPSSEDSPCLSLRGMPEIRVATGSPGHGKQQAEPASDHRKYPEHVTESTEVVYSVEEVLNAAKKYARQVRMVRTIWQIDRTVDLQDFYYPCPLDYGGKGKVVNVFSDFASLQNGRCFLVEGIAGQGKSIFLRHLCAEESLSGSRVGVFISLSTLRPLETKLVRRNHATASEQSGGTTVVIRTDLLDRIGAELSKVCLAPLSGANACRILLCLDAFDELPSDLVDAALREVGGLIEEYAELGIVVTSRPNARIHWAGNLAHVRFVPLGLEEIEQLVRVLVPETVDADVLVSRLKADSSGVGELLRTPLMAALLVVVCRGRLGFWPKKVAQFYEELFIHLLRRHDDSKPGGRRERKSGLDDDDDFRKVFNRLCYLYRRGRSSPARMEESSLLGMVKDAIQAIVPGVDPKWFLEDVVAITCLIVKDGLEFEFLHKTIPEYFHACFIRDWQDIGTVRAFYRRCAKSWEFRLRYQRELDFLRNLDGQRYKETFVLEPYDFVVEAVRIAENSGQDSTPEPPPVFRSMFEPTIVFCKRGSQIAVQNITVAARGVLADHAMEVLEILLEDMRRLPMFARTVPIMVEMNSRPEDLRESSEGRTGAARQVAAWDLAKQNSDLMGLCEKWIAESWKRLFADIRETEKEVARLRVQSMDGWA